MRLKSNARSCVLIASLAIFAAVAPTLAKEKETSQPAGKKSLGGSGEMIRFSLPAEGGKVVGLKIHGSRYGAAQAPDEKFVIDFLSPDMTEVLHTELAPYSLFERGEEKWVEVKFRKTVDIPTKEVWVAVDFRAGRTKGVYVSYDGSTDGKKSRVGLPGLEAKQPDFAGDWMIELTPPP
ncbi:MAG TPA: hypothetical protein VGJ26_13050 [Pirellulales bacterium]|jgi:hypothetical protein